MSKFKVGDIVVFKAHEHKISLFEGYTPLDLYEPQEVNYVIGDGSILLGNDREWWHESYFEHFDEWAKHQKKCSEDISLASETKHQKRVDTPQERLYTLAKAFIKDHNIVCEDDIYQSDNVIENAYQFLAEVFAIVGEQE